MARTQQQVEHRHATHAYTNIAYHRESGTAVHAHDYHGMPEMGTRFTASRDQDSAYLAQLAADIEARLPVRHYHAGDQVVVAEPHVPNLQITLTPLHVIINCAVMYTLPDGTQFNDPQRFDVPADMIDDFDKWHKSYHRHTRRKLGLRGSVPLPVHYHLALADITRQG